MPRDFSLESALALCAGAACVLTLATVSADAAETSAARVLRDCPACPEMVVIPAGEFMMGSEFAESGHPDEKPRHKVVIAKAFALSRTEVTFDQWAACVAEGKCREPSDDDLGRGDRPVINVTWQEARDFAAWLSAKTGQRYRLPTEAEWEYAARGGTATPWFWGTAESSFGSHLACEYANTHDETGKEAHPMYVWSNHPCADGFPETAPTGRFKPNAFGLHDMLGNVREWVLDCHKPGYEGAPTDGSAVDAEACEKRIVRGGAWIDGASTTRAAYRHPEKPDSATYQIGVRLLREM